MLPPVCEGYSPVIALTYDELKLSLEEFVTSKPGPQGDCNPGGNSKKEDIVFKGDQAARIGKPS